MSEPNAQVRRVDHLGECSICSRFGAESAFLEFGRPCGLKSVRRQCWVCCGQSSFVVQGSRMATHEAMSLTITAILRPCSVDLSICSRSVVFPLPCLSYISIRFSKRRFLSTHQKSRKKGDGKSFDLAVLLHFVLNLEDIWIGCTSRRMNPSTKLEGQEIRGEDSTITQIYCSLT